LKKVDCSKTIWILATNALDNNVVRFCERNKTLLMEESKQAKSNALDDLTKSMRKGLRTQWGAALTSRISNILPFLTFTPTEAAVVAEKFITDFASDVAKPVKISDDDPGDDRLLGNVHLRMSKPFNVYDGVAEQYYDQTEGAPSLLSRGSTTNNRAT
jgi:ATP-dependent Clp protease ATP-binding subunit ClpA